jgi:hypothetical protein
MKVSGGLSSLLGDTTNQAELQNQKEPKQQKKKLRRPPNCFKEKKETFYSE